MTTVFWTYLFLALLILMLAVRSIVALKHIAHVAANATVVPSAFSDSIDLPTHQKAAAYTQAKVRFGLLLLALEAFVLVAWTLGGGLNSLAAYLAQYLEPTSIAYGVALIAAFSLVGMVIDLPFSWIFQFNIEEKFGFNRMTPALFWQDTVKGLALGAALGLPILAALLWVMRNLGDNWWLWAGALLIGIQIVMLWAYPTLIAPLFNKFMPLEDEALQSRIQGLADKTGFKLNSIMVMDGSKRSGHGNAYFAGFGRSKRIVFFDTLLSQLTPPQIEAVLAHELGHFKHKHIIKRMFTMSITLFTMLAVVAWLAVQPQFYAALGVVMPISIEGKGGHEALALLLFGLAAPVVLFLTGPLSNYWSRKHEFEADAFAAQTSSAKDLCDALVAMYRDNAATLTPHPWYSFIHDTHPSAPVRIAALNRLKPVTENVTS